MGVATRHSPSATLAGTSASNTSAPSLTLPKQTERPSALFRPRFGNGLMPKPIQHQIGRPRAADLAAPIQLAPTPRWYKISNADQQARFDQGQPLEAPHLERGHHAFGHCRRHELVR